MPNTNSETQAQLQYIFDRIAPHNPVVVKTDAVDDVEFYVIGEFSITPYSKLIQSETISGTVDHICTYYCVEVSIVIPGGRFGEFDDVDLITVNNSCKSLYDAVKAIIICQLEDSFNMIEEADSIADIMSYDC